MPFLFGALAAIGWGVGDYLGTRASVRTSVFATTAVAEAVGLLAVLPFAIMVGGDPRLVDVAWASLAGLFGSISLAGLFTLLKTGTFTVLAPLAGVTAAGGAMAFGLAAGERPSTLALIGVPLALFAVVLLSIEMGSTQRSRLSRFQVGFGIALGLGFAMYDIALSQIPDTSGISPFLAARVAGATVMVLALILTRDQIRASRQSLQLASLGGVLDGLGGAAFLAAVQRGLLTLVAPLAALFPVVTVLCGTIFEKERLTRIQFAGLGLAIVSLPLLSVG